MDGEESALAPGAPPPAGDATLARPRCAYCGGPLDARWYFCQACATPYTSPESVLPRVTPAPLFPGERIRRRAPQAMTVFWTYAVVLFVGSVVVLLTTGDRNVLAQFVVMDVLMLLTTLVLAFKHGRALLPQLRQPGFTHWAGVVGVLAVAPLLALNAGYHEVLTRFVGLEGPSLGQQLREAGFSTAGMVLSICVLPAVTEEIAFRGMVQHWLHVAVTPRQAILYASLLFAGIHLSVPSLPVLFLAGCLLGWMRWKTGSLYPSMLAHFLHNLGVIAFLG